MTGEWQPSVHHIHKYILLASGATTIQIKTLLNGTKKILNKGSEEDDDTEKEIDYEDYICMTLFDDYPPFRKVQEQIHKREHYYNSVLISRDQREHNQIIPEECIGVVALVDRELSNRGYC